MLQRAVKLAQWAGPDGRPLTSRGVLRKPDVPAACAAIEVALPERFRSAGDIQDLHRPWTVALALGLLTVNGSRAASGPALGEWPPTAAALPGRWLDGLLAICDATCQDPHHNLGLRLQLMAALRILDDLQAGRQGVAFHELYAVAHSIADDHGLDHGEADLIGGSSDLSGSFLYDSVGALLDLLAGFGAVTLPPGGVTPLERAEQNARTLPAITPLGRWGAEAITATLPKSVAPEATPAEAIAAAAAATPAGLWATVRRWLAARKPEVAVRELMEAADPLPARLRAAAVDAARMAGPDGLPGWAAIAEDAATWPNSARQARAELHLWEMDATGVVTSPDPADWHWMVVEGAAAALQGTAADRHSSAPATPEAVVDQGADEALCRLWEAAGEAGSIDAVLAFTRASGHPEAEQLSAAVTALAASGSPLTIHRAIQLKVTLRHSRPPIWRSVQVPLLFTLGDLHRVIQVLFDWDDDHLHDFTVGATHYSSAFFDLDETEDEDDARLRDVFSAGARKPVLYEYDFGESWIHEITREKVFAVDPAHFKPACVAFSGDQPVEYPDVYDEDEDSGQPCEREPFSLADVNAALAELTPISEDR